MIVALHFKSQLKTNSLLLFSGFIAQRVFNHRGFRVANEITD